MRRHSKVLRQLGWRQRSGTTRGRLTGAMSQQQLLSQHRGRCRKTRFDLRHTAEINSYWRRLKKPTSFRTKFQRVLYEGATARKDAEEDERSRWLHILAGIVLNTDTPMAKMLREKPGNAQLLGAGKRASTLRARIRSLRRYTLWLSTAYGISFPSETAHFVEYLRVRSQEPTTRGGLKAAHQATRFYEEITAVPEQARLSESTVYSLAKKEFLAAALPGKFPRQAPRFPAALLAALEETVCDLDTTLYYRIYGGWWVLVQCWGTLRFSDHRGLSPSDAHLDSEGFVGKLTRSKTIEQTGR